MSRILRYKLTQELVASHGGEVVCLDARAIGRVHRLYSERPGPELNERIISSAVRSSLIRRSDVVSATGDVEDVSPASAEDPSVIRVDIRGPIEQRSEGADECGGWAEGHDTIAERMVAALETSDVLLVIDSPGGAHAGLQEAVRRVLEAKAEHGRTVTVYADEMIGSAAYWWAACVGDEIFAPESAIVGSIGARSAHGSVAEALKKQGVAVTYFAWPNEGKVAFAPELPLSELGKQRGERDVAIAGESFAAAVGPARGLSRKQIVKLSADALPGKLALEAGLIDGIASYEDVMIYALATAGAKKGSTDSGEGDDSMAIAKPGVRSEDPEKDPKDPKDKMAASEPEKGDPEKEDAEPEKSEPAPEKADKACGECGADNDDDAKFCDACGKKLSADEEPEHEDEADEEEKPEGKPEEKPEKSDKRASLGFAAIFGLHNSASLPAVKTSAMAYASLGKAVMSATGTDRPDLAEGALKSLVDDAKEVGRLRAENKAAVKRENHRERKDLLTKLASLDVPGYRRGDLFVDKADENGKQVTSIAPVYAEMKLGTLRGLVDAKSAGHAAQPRNPFEPNRAAAEDAKIGAEAEAELGSSMTQRVASNSTASPETISKSIAALRAAGVIQ